MMMMMNNLFKTRRRLATLTKRSHQNSARIIKLKLKGISPEVYDLKCSEWNILGGTKP